MSVKDIGCCGAYCRTCPALGTCQGCKLGYDHGKRKLENAKCQIKRCCIARAYQTCAECPEYALCRIIEGFYAHKGYKYGKYKEALEFIRVHGYAAFVRKANQWRNAYGAY